MVEKKYIIMVIVIVILGLFIGSLTLTGNVAKLGTKPTPREPSGGIKTTTTIPSTTTTNKPGCFDSDNGINIFIAGYVDVYNFNTGNSTRVYDVCVGSTFNATLTEYYCNNSTSTIGIMEDINCPTGYQCRSGACRLP